MTETTRATTETRVEVDPLPGGDHLAFVEASLRNSFAIDAVHVGADHLTIVHRESESADAIRSMTRRYVFIAKNIDRDRVFDNPAPGRYVDDPQPPLEAAGDVATIAPGFFSFQGDFLRVFKAIDRTTLGLAAEVGAIEQEHPAVWPVALFKAIDYFHEFPQQMILCAPVKDDHASRSLFSKRYGRDADFETVPMGELMADAAYGLQPAVCDCCYYALRGRQSHADTFYTTCNKVFRNERSPTGRLDRMTNFTVRDIMFVGSEAFVLESRQRLIEMLSRLIVSLQLDAIIETANDPFFANDAAMKTVFQNVHRLKYELLARIPHLQREIAVGSVNLHTDFFGRAFGIRLADGSTAHSGCIGVGMERMTYALFCQHGPDLADWPPALLGFLGLQASGRAGPGETR